MYFALMSKRPYNTVVSICIFTEYMAESYPNEQFYDCVMSPDLEELSKSLENFARSQSAINPTFAFWLMYIEMVQILLLFIRATRENNWELHLSAVRLMLPWFFVADRIHYARYGTMYWLEMSCLENTHPGKVLLISWLDLVYLISASNYKLFASCINWK